MKRQIYWNLFFATGSTRNAIFCPAQQNNPVRIIGTGIFFFAGSLRQNAIFLSCATKNSGPLKVDRNLFLREALSKTQDSGANTRLALIIFKGGNGNWIFLPCLAEAGLSGDCFNNLRASGSNIVPGPRGLTGHGDVMHICDMLYVSCYSATPWCLSPMS